MAAPETMAVSELCYLSANEAIARFKARTLSPVELVEALIARHEEVEARINATTILYHDRALEQARRAEARYTRPGARLRRLEGVPVMIKDLHSIKGERNPQSCRIFARDVATDTLPTVERLLRAGAIPLARATSSELGIPTVCTGALWGVTRNPWNLAMSPGGSSGGSGAALAAGMTPIADGSDFGGSLRIPASACGVFGYKPPFGRNPQDRGGVFESYLHYGPMARSVADGALMQNVMSGQHPHDLATLRERVVLPRQPGSIKGFKVALSMDLGYKRIDPEVERATRHAAQVFRDLGCAVEEVDLGWTSATVSAWEVRSKTLVAHLLGPYLLRWRHELLPDCVRDVEQGRAFSIDDLLAGRRIRAEMWMKLSPILSRYHLLLCPTLALPSLPADHSIFDGEVVIEGERVEPYVGWCLTYPFNTLGQLPVASVPSGVAANGVPTGVQLVGRPYDDVSVFRAALAYEATFPWLRPGETPMPDFREPGAQSSSAP